MVARKAQQDGLPPGWTVQLKELRSGRTIRYFVNSQTGQNFSSEEDLIRHVKMKNTLHSQKEEPHTDKRHVERHSENIEIKVVEETGEKWLPDDWEVEIKIRNTGSSSGTKYKCYIEPSTGRKFYSKPEVFLYLEGVKHVKRKSCLSDQKKAGTVGHSASKASCAAKRQKLQQPTSRLQAFTGKQSSDRSSLAVPETDTTAEIVSEKPSVEKQNDHYECTSTNYQAVSSPASDLKGNISLESGMENSVRRSNSSKSNKKKWLNLPCRFSKRLAGLHSELPKVEFSETNQQKSTVTDDRAVSNFASDLLGKNSLEREMEKSSRSRNNSGKHNKKGRLDLPRRSSKRLAVLKTVMPKVELSETNQQKSNLNSDKAVFDSSVDLVGKNSLESGMQKSNNRRTRIIYGKSNKKKGLDLPRRSSKRLAGLKTALPKVELSEKSQQEIPLSDNKSVLNSAPELTRKNSQEKGMEKSSSKRSSNNSRKSNKKSGLDVPRRSSERLAGLKAEMSKNTSSSENAFQNAVMECENEVVPAMDFTPDISVDEASGPFEARPIAELARHCFSVEIIPSIGELLDKSQKYLDDKVVPSEQLQKLETEKPNCEKSDLLFGDPCLEFAFKTLNGAMSREDAVANIPISTCAADILQGKNLRDSKMEKSRDKKSLTDVSGSNEKKELNMPFWPSKQNSGLEHELVGSSARQISARKSCETKPYLDFDLNLNNLPNGASHKLNSGPEMGLAHRDLLHPNALLHEEPSKSKQILNDRNVAEEEFRSIGSVKVNSDKPVSQLVFPSVDYWSDPCLEFAFKTLTGAIPLDDNFAFPDYPQPLLDTSHKERDSNMVLPDFGLPSHFQSEISSHFDTSERQPGTRQQLPLNPSVPPPPGNKSLPSCSAVGAQQPFVEQNKDIQEKVSS